MDTVLIRFDTNGYEGNTLNGIRRKEICSKVGFVFDAPSAFCISAGFVVSLLPSDSASAFRHSLLLCLFPCIGAGFVDIDTRQCFRLRRLIDALEMMKHGVQRLLVRKSVTWRGISKRFSVLYYGKWLKSSDSTSMISPTSFCESSSFLSPSKEDGYCCLSREDVIRFIIGCLGAIAPIPLSSISSLAALSDNFCFIEVSAPALEFLHNYPQNPCAAAVVEIAADGTRKIIGEISAFKLWKCDYVAAAWAMANLSAGQFVMGSEDEEQDLLPDFLLASQVENGIVESPRPKKFSSRSIGFFSQQLVGGLRSTRSMYRGRSAPLTCRKTSSLAAVMAQMLSNRATHVWVTEDEPEENILVGIVSYNDILHAVTMNPASVSPVMP